MRELLLEHLYPLDKYEIALVGAGVPFKDHPDFARYPFKCFGTIPAHIPELMHRMQDPNVAKDIQYGMAWAVDEALKEFHADVIFLVEDIWAFAGLESKKWLNKISTVVHTTLDSLPVLPRAYELAKVVDNFFVWSEFSQKEMNANGAPHVKTIHGCVNTKVYRALEGYKKRELRDRFNIPQDTFCIGMLSRNQLRKGFPSVIEGYALFKKQNPKIKSKLLLFTNYSEGWSLETHRQYAGLASEDILCCYKCRATGEYFVMPFRGERIANPKNPQITVNENGHQTGPLMTVGVGHGITEEQVNEWFGLLDCHIHPITSGALERSVSESRLAEVPVLINPYSCFADQVDKDGVKTGSIELQQSFSFEMGTGFRKASVSEFEIAKKLKRVYEMGPEKRRALGREGRQFVLDYYSIDVVGKKIEDVLDSLPFSDWDFDFSEKPRNPEAVIPEALDNKEFITSLYKLILAREADEGGFNYWMAELAKGAPREGIINFFRETGRKENASVIPLKNELDELPGKKEDRVLINIPKSFGDCVNFLSLLPDARAQYSDKLLFLACEKPYQELFQPFIGTYLDGVIEFKPQFDDTFFLEGRGSHQGYFSTVLQSHFLMQRTLNSRSGADKISLDLTLN